MDKINFAISLLAVISSSFISGYMLGVSRFINGGKNNG